MHQSIRQFTISVLPTLAAAAILALAALASSSAHAAITLYGLFKLDIYQQTSSTQPSTADLLFGFASIHFDNPADFTSAQITSPSPLSPMILSPFDGVFGFSQAYTSPAALHGDFPSSSTYEFQVAGGTLGTQSASLTLPAENLYPAQIPFFTGAIYDNLQGMNPHNPFAFSWNGFSLTPGANVTGTFFGIVRASDGQVAYSATGDHTLTSTVLPAGTLQPDTAYVAFVDYASQIASPDAGFDGASSLIGFAYRTEIPFVSAPEPSTFATALAAIAVGAIFYVCRRWRPPIAIR